jgi:glycosyltransferase involved in cell wall biosynthesis
MKKDIAILLPYKEKYNIKQAGAASIWVKDYLNLSKLNSRTIVYGNLDNNSKPLTNNFRNIDLKNKIIRKNISYTNKLYEEYLVNNFSIIEIHNRPESLLYLIKKKIKSKLIFVFHNNPKDMRGSTSIQERLFIARNTTQIYFVSNWVKNKFFEGLNYNNRNNCEILYPGIKPLTTFPRKKKLIIFCGKLNSSKGYDIFGSAILKILDKFKDWKAIAIGNEPREQYNFLHKNYKVLDWIQHKKILEYYSKASISVVPSRWLEPFGRTAMESAAHGCATITSKNGGLPETFDNDLFLDKISSKEIYRLVLKLVKNPKLRKKIQKKNFSNVKHKLLNKVKQLDSFKKFLLSSQFNFNKGSKLKILHISQFDDRNDYRLFNISISSKLSKGLLEMDTM